MADKKDGKPLMTKDRFFSENIAAFVKALESPTKIYPGADSTWAQVSYVAQTEKSVEIDRQIQRIRPYLSWLSEEDETGVDEDALNSSIAFLSAFANSPAPVPMLAIGNDGKASAYLNSCGMSLEALFDEGNVQYLLTDLETSKHQYFEDDCKNGAIPPSLMVLIYQHFARNTGKQLSSRNNV